MRTSTTLLFVVSIFIPSLRALEAAQPAVGQIAKVFDLQVSRIVADPVRPRMYASVPSSNSVKVIDTNTLTISKELFVGSSPADMAISPDGSTLYVANDGSSTSAIGVIDLNTLRTKPSFSLPSGSASVAAGCDGRLYAMTQSQGFVSIYQLDAVSGAIQATIGSEPEGSPFDFGFDYPKLLATPDGKTLLVAEQGSGKLYCFDISSAKAKLLQSKSSAGNGATLAISHNGRYFILSGSGGNYRTGMNSTGDIDKQYGGFKGNLTTASFGYPGPFAFSADDTVTYEFSRGSNPFLRVYKVGTFLQFQDLPISLGGTSQFSSFEVTSPQVDNTGSYLFAGEQDVADSNLAYLVVFTTGRGYLTPPALLPVIACANRLDFPAGAPCNYQVPTLNNPTHFSASSLPAGLTIDPASGVISGTPSKEYESNTVIITAENSAGAATLPVNVGIRSEGFNVTSPLKVDATVGQSVRYQITTDHRTTSFSGGDLPAGLSLDGVTGLITGTALKFGYEPFTVKIDGGTDYANYAFFWFQVRSPEIVTPSGGTVDLAGSVGAPKIRLKGGKYKIAGTYLLANVGGQAAKRIEVGAYLSKVPTVSLPVTGEEENLQALDVSVTGADGSQPPALRIQLGEGASARLPLKFKLAGKKGASHSLPFSCKVSAEALESAVSAGYGYLLLVADPKNLGGEKTTGNNVAVVDLSRVGSK